MTEDPNFGSNTTVCAGGRYDSLVEQVGGPSTPGFGFGIGLERLVMLLENSHFDFPEVAALDAFIVTIGNAANKEALKVASILRAAGLNVEREFLNRKPAKQFKTADKLNAKYVFTLGENELNKGTINVKLLETGKETVLSLDKVSKDNIVEYLKEIENSLKD